MNLDAKSQIAERIAGAIALLALAISAVYFAHDQHLTQIAVQMTFGKMNTTIDALNAPCKDFHGDYECGPIPQLSQTEKNIGIMAGDLAKQVNQSGQLTTAAANSILSVSAKLNDELTSLKSATDAVTTLTNKGTETLGIVQTTLGDAVKKIPDTQPLVDASTGTINDAHADLNRFVQSPLMKDDAVQVHGMLVHGNALTGDAQIEADKFTHPNKKKIGFFGALDATVMWLHSHVIPPFF
jgi:hypothetical protein